MKTLFNSIFSFFRIFWNIITFTKHVFGNIIFIIICLFIIAAILTSTGSKKDIISDNSALFLNISGDIVEQKSYIDPLFSALNQSSNDPEDYETLLKDIIDVIDYAKTDNRIKLLVLKLDNMGNSGICKLQDIGKALLRFKKSGKKIISIGSSFSQNQYYLAAHADKIFMHPMGSVNLNGFGQYRMYIKKALSNLMVNVHIFKVGKYKSAVEPLLRDDMSKEAKEANILCLQSLWSAYTTDVTKLRKLKPDAIDNYINHIAENLKEVNGDTAKMALSNRLIDKLMPHDEMNQYLTDIVGNNLSNELNKVNFNRYLSGIYYLINKKSPYTDKVGVIIARGSITQGDQPSGKIGSQSLSKLIKKARENTHVKSLVLRIDSGGGSAFASEIIRREVELTQLAGKPVIISMGSVAASGGYWIGATADEIWASPTTITGSIGIFGAFPTFEKSLKHLGINSDGVGTTNLADAFNPTRPINPVLEKAMQLTINNGYNYFINLVSKGRKIPLEKVKKIAEGRVWSGEKAFSLELVDNLGNLKDAIISSAQKANLKNYEVEYIEKEPTTRELFLKNFGKYIHLITGFFKTGYHHKWIKILNYVDSSAEFLEQMNDPSGMYAKCLNCDVQ